MANEDIKAILLQKDKEYLSELIVMLLSNLEDEKRMDFTSRYINAKVVLSELNELENDEFLAEIKAFCKECLDGKHYVEAEYDDYSDSYDEEVYEDSIWASKFGKYFMLAVIHARNGETDIAYRALDYLFECIRKAQIDEEMLGTSDPLEFIDIDAGETLEMYFDMVIKCEADTISAYRKLFDMWLEFYYYCKMPMSLYVKDLPKSVIALKEIVKNGSGFACGEKIFLLIKSLYEQSGAYFDALSIATDLVQFEPNFSIYMAQGYFEGGQYEQAIETALEYSVQIEGENEQKYGYRQSDGIPKQLKTIMVDSYERSGQIDNAYAAALAMFRQYTTYELYKRTRHLAEKVMDIEVFIDETEEFLTKQKTDNKYSGNNKLLYWQVLSFEGRRDKLIAAMPRELKNQSNWKYSIDNNYDVAKYTVQSLIYACVGSGDADDKLPNLSEFVEWLKDENRHSEKDGVFDMVAFEEDQSKRERYLTEVVSILRMMAQFHIDAANRERYANAAYYIGIADDICKMLGKSAESQEFIKSLMTENNRRRAFKDEMQKKFKNLR